MTTERLPLTGLRCIEMCWVWSGPMMGQFLADLGAEVIKVEWYDRYDLYRTRGVERLRGTIPEDVRREMSFSFHSLNRGKLGLTANLKLEAGLEVVRDLVSRSHTLIENFTAGTLDRLGLAPESLRELNEKLVVVSLSASGKGSGVERLRAYGLVLSALGGSETALVDEDGELLGSPTFVVSDPNAAAFGTFAATAGLLHALRSGRGATYECSQIEAIVSLMTAARTDDAPPPVHAVVQTADDDHVALSGDLTPAELDRLSREASTSTSDDFVDRAVAGGVHAAPVRNLTDHPSVPAYADAPVRLPTLHPTTGAETVVAAPWRMDGGRPLVRKPAPRLGESNDYVLRVVLGYDDARIASLTSSGAV